jgi:hypothetical protein
MADSKAEHKDGELERYIDGDKEVDYVDPSSDEGLPESGQPAHGGHQPIDGRQHSAIERRLSQRDGLFPMVSANPS